MNQGTGQRRRPSGFAPHTDEVAALQALAQMRGCFWRSIIERFGGPGQWNPATYDTIGEWINEHRRREAVDCT